ncbi:MAG: Na(+)-translocating NADH-quinone reductase subunit A [bacterium]|nr:Na(+)-translocating NADH-quinone reductase subunit A [bacterium]
MSVHTIRKGLALPISGAPEQRIERAPAVAQVGVLAGDYPFMKPSMRVKVGDEVRRGQVLFEDRKTNGVRFTSPGAGKVTVIHRGPRRALISVVVQLSRGEAAGGDEADQISFSSYSGDDVSKLDGEQVRALLAESGLWTALRTRPFSKVPSPSESCHSIFVTAIDTNPLCADPEVVLEGRERDFRTGLAALSKLTEGAVWLCRGTGSKLGDGGVPRVEVEEFSGHHPAGLAGTHIHLLDPVSRGKTVWHVGYQDVAAIGHLFSTGRLDLGRVVALGGPAVRSPRLLRTRLGAAVGPLVEGELTDGEVRVVSGSVLNGRSTAEEGTGFLGRYHQQISCLPEGRERRFIGWLMPGFKLFSTIPAYTGSLRGRSHRFDMNTSTHGGHRAMVPIGMFEPVMPLDIMPTFLLRSLLVDDLEQAEALGCLELDEEDLALCTFVSPGKEDYGPALRRNLTEIWKEG